MRVISYLLVATCLLGAGLVRAEDIKIRPERPRIWLRAKADDGPSIEKIRQWMKTPEYQGRSALLPKTMMGNAILCVINGDREAGKKAIESLKAFKWKPAESWSNGIELEKCAAVFDWLHDHPDFDETSRKERVGYFEGQCEKIIDYLKKGGETPFYSRLSGAITALTVMSLAIAGDSPKAQQYADYAAAFFQDKFSSIRQIEDGATGGATYGMFYEFTDMAHLATVWRTATNWDAAAWIKETQSDWLNRQLQFQIWMTYPNGWLVKEGDVWENSHADKYEYRMPIDAVTNLYRSGIGRTFADQMAERWKHSADYYSEYVWEFYVFNDPEVKPEPLDKLGRATVFSPKLHGYVCWRSSWQPDATIVHFKCGETVDHHGSWDQGKFLIFKTVPLAIKNGGYIGGYLGGMHLYYKSPWSANCVVFNTPPGVPPATQPDGKPGIRWAGYQPHIDFDNTPSWAEWKAERDKRYKRPPTGVLLETEANERFARARGDLTGSCPPGTTWTRELVFLGYKYVLVCDRVKAAPGIQHRWLLHTINEPAIDGQTIKADNGAARLFCRTLLPADAKLTSRSGKGNEYLHLNQKGEERRMVDSAGNHWAKFDPKKSKPEQQLGVGRVDVEPSDGAKECIYLHVLFPTDTGVVAMPACSVRQDHGNLAVTVGTSSYTFKMLLSSAKPD